MFPLIIWYCKQIQFAYTVLDSFLTIIMKRISCSLASIILLSNVGAFVAYADFSDVPDSYPNSTAISYVQSHGIVKGYDDGTYRPDSLINRAEFTKIIVAGTTTEAQRSECKFNENLLTVAPRDVDITAWYAPYVCMALLDEIVRGYPDGTFQPDQNIKGTIPSQQVNSISS